MAHRGNSCPQSIGIPHTDGAAGGQRLPHIRGPGGHRAKEIRWQFGGYRMTVRRMSPLLLVDLGPSGIPRGFEISPFGVEVGSTSRRRLSFEATSPPLLHHVQHVILERRLTSRKRATHAAGPRVPWPAVLRREAPLVARRPRTDVSHFGFEPALIRIDIGQPSLQLAASVPRTSVRRVLSASAASSGKCAAPVGQLGKRRIGSLEVEQPQLSGGVGVHSQVRLDSVDGAWSVHGSVISAETVTLRPSSRIVCAGGGDGGEPRRLGRPVRGIDQAHRVGATLAHRLDGRMMLEGRP